MKYTFVSFIVHILFLVGVFYFGKTLTSHEPTNVVVELYLPPATEPETKPKKPPTPKLAVRKSSAPAQKTSKPVATPVSSGVNSVNDDRASERDVTEKFLRSQEGQKMVASYVEELKVYLEQNKIYPRTALKLRQTGTVKIRLQISTDGRFGDIQIVSPSRFDSLNQAAVKLLRKLGHFKPLPEKLKQGEAFVIPIAYQMQGGRF